MNKTKFLSFIDKFHLNGECNKVKIDSEDGILKCRFLGENQDLVGEVNAREIELDNAEFGVYNTSNLIKMLSAVDEDLDVRFDSQNDTLSALIFKDASKTTVTYMLAELAVIPDVPALTQTPDATVTIMINEEFMTKFIKSKNAIPDAVVFAVSSETGDRADITINWSQLNTPRITFTVDAQGSSLEPICFNAEYLKSIFTANKGAKSGVIKVSQQGLAIVSFHGNDYDATYYLVKKEV